MKYLKSLVVICVVSICILSTNLSAQMTWACACSSAQWLVRGDHSSVVFNDKMWVMGGFTGHRIALNDVWYSSDGVNWTQATASAGWVRYGHTSVVFDNKMWVMGWINDVWYSTGLGIEENSIPNAQCVTPNATIVRGVLNLQSSISNLQSKISLLDITGRKVADLRSGANNIRHLAPGVYFVRSNKNNQVTKIIVTR